MEIKKFTLIIAVPDDVENKPTAGDIAYTLRDHDREDWAYEVTEIKDESGK